MVNEGLTHISRSLHHPSSDLMSSLDSSHLEEGVNHIRVDLHDRELRAQSKPWPGSNAKCWVHRHSAVLFLLNYEVRQPYFFL